MNKTRSHFHMFFKNKSSLFICIWSHEFSLFFSPVRLASAQLMLFPPFSLPGVVSPPTNIVTPPCCVTLHSHWVKTSSLPLFYLLTTLCPVASPLEPKLKHLICTTAAGYFPRTTRLPSSTAIKRSSQPWPLSSPLNRISILSPP
jgi:hypothetical protein